jgi:hypothetical protein
MRYTTNIYLTLATGSTKIITVFEHLALDILNDSEELAKLAGEEVIDASLCRK